MAKDIYHESVKEALKLEGWTITHDPYPIKIGNVRMFIDLGAEQIIAAEKENQKIAIEIKSFVDDSAISAFHEAVGQYDNYQIALEDEEPERILYLAIPLSVYNNFFQEPFIQKVILKKHIKLIIFDINSTSLKWKN
ncbi:MAG: XisH family protein [Spirosomataceae bacterium]